MAAMEDLDEIDDAELRGMLEQVHAVEPAPVAVKEAKGMSFIYIGFHVFCQSCCIIHYSFKCVLSDCVGIWLWWFVSMQEAADQEEDYEEEYDEGWDGWQEGYEEEYLDEMVDEETT